MAKETDTALRSQVLYCVYVRSHTREGTFQALRRDLERIKSLGTDVIWLMPIHPVGEQRKKGSLGCPYAVRDYRAVNPAYGAMEDFRALVEEIHRLGMRCIIDIVYNHTAPDSWLAQNHPEWFHHDTGGAPVNRVADWSDVVDLDYSSRALWDYQIETLKQWAAIVDGFRCDAASMVPLEFWREARAACAQVKEGLLWLAESVYADFVRQLRAMGMPCWSDGELYQVFDVAYDYDIWPWYEKYLRGEISLPVYIEVLRLQDGLYPENYVKLRCLENHDRPRIAGQVTDRGRLEQLTAFQMFQRGMALLYAGQEWANVHTPSLFEKETVDRETGTDLSPLLRRLAEIKKDEITVRGSWELREEGGAVYARYRLGDRLLCGVFRLEGDGGRIAVELPDGKYPELLYGGIVEVSGGAVASGERPLIFEGTL